MLDAKEHYTAEKREALVALFRQSGLSKKEFCQQEQLSYSMFKRWCGDKKSARAAHEEKFYRLSVPSLSVSSSFAAPKAIARLLFPNGFILELPSDYPLSSLKGLLG